MKYSFFGFLIFSILILVSCGNDNSNFENDKAFESELREGDVMSQKDCFEFEYPIGLVFPDGKVESINEEDEYYKVLKIWYKSNPKDKEKPGLEYPVNVIFKGEKTKTISNEKEMIDLKKYCDDKDGKDDEACFEMVYPLSYEMPDGVLITGENEDELNTAIKAWYEMNPDSKEKYRLVYPVDVLLKDGSTVTIENEAEMIELKKDC